jgi:hypothetical protein
MLNDDQNQYDFPDENNDPIAQESKSPAVKDDSDPFSGSASDSVAVDIDDELAKVGLKGDSNGDIKPLDIENEID